MIGVDDRLVTPETMKWVKVGLIAGIAVMPTTILLYYVLGLTVDAAWQGDNLMRLQAAKFGSGKRRNCVIAHVSPHENHRVRIAAPEPMISPNGRVESHRVRGPQFSEAERSADRPSI